MAKFMKKPVEIEATQWFKFGDHPAVTPKYKPNTMHAEDPIPWVETLEGGHIVTPGDWIITGVKGEHYPCKPDIFALTYEESNQTPTSIEAKDAEIASLRQQLDKQEAREALIKEAVNRFLGWKLPHDFSPDGGISFTPEYNKEYMATLGKPPSRHEPTGTNLLTAEQAKAMFEYVLAAPPKDNKPRWQPIETAPKDNKRLLYLARFVDGKLVELDFDGRWEYWQESWEMSHINGYCWVSNNGIEEPTHWAYQDEPLPTT